MMVVVQHCSFLLKNSFPRFSVFHFTLVMDTAIHAYAKRALLLTHCLITEKIHYKVSRNNTAKN